jgi:TetR/AcrR family transcriptional regulator, transcriptional repressor for nem operon
MALTTKGRATRQRIVRTAADLMLTAGVHRTTLDDVGSAATVGRSQLYHYFADKGALVRDVIREQTDAVIDGQGPDYLDLTSWAAWQAWRDRTVERAALGGCVGGCPLGSLGTEVAESDEDARELVSVGFRRWETGFRDGIATMRERGLLRPDTDPEALATAVVVALQGGLLLAQVHRDVRPLAIGLDGAITLIATHATTPGAPGGVS